MTTENNLIAVTGATGQQGGAVAARLLAKGWRVRALTRNPTGSAAVRLAAAGAEVVAADMDDRAGLAKAFAGAWGVYSVHPGGYDGNEYSADSDHEIRSGVNVADAALAVGAGHLVYSSSVGLDNPELTSALTPMANKLRVEEHIRSLDISATVLRPASFMENYVGDIRGLTDGALVTGLDAEYAEPLIAVADIGAFAELAFADPKAYRGEVLELAGDSLTQSRIAAAIGEAVGREVPYVHMDFDQLGSLSPDVAKGLATINRNRLTVDIAGLRERHPELLDFAAWLAVNRQAVIAKVNRTEPTG